VSQNFDELRMNGFGDGMVVDNNVVDEAFGRDAEAFGRARDLVEELVNFPAAEWRLPDIL